MDKSLTASKNLMKTYLSELLTEPEQSDNLSQQCIYKEVLGKPLTYKATQSVETLLKTVSEPKEKTEVNEEIAVKKENNTAIDILPVAVVGTQCAKPADLKEKSYLQGDFQAMYFDVAGLTIAVPLIELGGILKIDKTTSLLGKPDWFKGVMLYREEKINVVDTALWVMPEKYDEALKNALNYQYIIMLNDSPWGLMAEHLVDTVVLSQDEVKWLGASNKRPWLAGLVKEKMCALVDVSALIELLDKGSNIYQA